jgi:hypothetical protein
MRTVYSSDPARSAWDAAPVRADTVSTAGDDVRMIKQGEAAIVTFAVCLWLSFHAAGRVLAGIVARLQQPPPTRYGRCSASLRARAPQRSDHASITAAAGTSPARQPPPPGRYPTMATRRPPHRTRILR